MKRNLFALFLLISSATLLAAPAKRVTKTITVSGRQVEVTLRGNEKLHFWQSADGMRYQEAENHSYVLLSDETVKSALASRKFQTKKETETVTSMHKARAKRKIKYSGQQRALVILAQFQDKKFSIADSASLKPEYEKVMTQENYTENFQHGSVRDYFKAQSYGMFDFVVDVVGPYTLPEKMAYYGANDRDGNDLKPATMVYHAVQAADADVDYSTYDWDGDGEVELVYVIYAGYGESQGADKSTVWPHAWSLSSAPSYGETDIDNLVFDNVKVDDYACSCELNGSSGKSMDGIGTICHELSHCFGLPDFYCTDDSHWDLTMDEWSILDYGCYGNNGYCPVSYTAYERWACGWLEPTELNTPQYVEGMSDIDENGESYILYNEANKDEFYILQNIQRKGWNSYAPGHGMLVVHVDYDDEAWMYNTVNNVSSHLRMSPICADNKRGGYDLTGDPYPGTSRNTQLTDNSQPAATLFNANTDGRKFMHKPITEIAESSDGRISFTFMGGEKVEVPTGIKATEVHGLITATWDEGADDIASYNIKYGIYDETGTSEESIIDEDFRNCVRASDGNSDISLFLNQYLSASGFTGTKLYQGTKGLKMGSSKADGQLISPALEERSGKIKIRLASEIYGTVNNATLTVSVFENGYRIPFYISESLPVGVEQVLEVSGVPQGYFVSVDAYKRCYLTKYQIVSSGDKAYTNAHLLDGITAVPYTFQPFMSAPVYWLQVQAVSQRGNTSEWSDVILIENVTAVSPICLKDAIPSLASGKHSPAYNLQGQRVGSGYSGIIVRNGKKYLLP